MLNADVMNIFSCPSFRVGAAMVLMVSASRAQQLDSISGCSRYTRQPGEMVLAETGTFYASETGFSPSSMATYKESDLLAMGLPKATLDAADGKVLVGAATVEVAEKSLRNFTFSDATYYTPWGDVKIVGWKGGETEISVASVKARKRSVKEGAATTIVFSLKNPAEKPLAIYYKISGTVETSDYSLSGPEDYVLIPKGNKSAQLKVNATKDRDKSPRDKKETLVVTLKSMSDYRIGNPRKAKLTILGK